MHPGDDDDDDDVPLHMQPYFGRTAYNTRINLVQVKQVHKCIERDSWSLSD